MAATLSERIKFFSFTPKELGLDYSIKWLLAAISEMMLQVVKQSVKGVTWGTM